MAQRTSYGAAADEVVELFNGYLSGNSNQPILVVVDDNLSDTVLNALEKSLVTLGFSKDAFSLVSLTAHGQQAALQGDALMLLIEGLDPLRIICCDENSALALESTYRESYKRNAINRIMGRTSAVFTNLDELITNEAGKRVAWELFKALRG